MRDAKLLKLAGTPMPPKPSQPLYPHHGDIFTEFLDDFLQFERFQYRRWLHANGIIERWNKQIQERRAA